MGSYDVVITGFNPGSDQTEVRSRLAQLFKAAPSQIDKMCDALPFTVKRSVDATTAAQYRNALERAGVRCEVVERHLSADLPPSKEEPRDGSPPVAPPKAKRSIVSTLIYSIGALMVFGGLGAKGYDYFAKQFGRSDAPPTLAISGKSNPINLHEQKLRKHAIQDLHDSKFSLAKRDGLCDRIADEEFDFTFGTAAINVDGTEKRRMLPASVVRHGFTCVMNALAQKEREEQWNILALDDEFQVLRCIRTGPAQIVASLYVECAFQPAGGVPPKFPSPDRVDEPFRSKYTDLLARIRAQSSSPNPATAAAAPQSAIARYEQLHAQKPAAVWTEEDAVAAVKILASASGEEARLVLNEARERSRNECSTAACFNGQREFEAARRLLVGEVKTVEEALRAAPVESRPTANVAAATEAAKSANAGVSSLDSLAGYWFCPIPGVQVNYAFFKDGTYVREISNQRSKAVTQTAGRAVVRGSNLVTLSLLIRGPEGLGGSGEPPWEVAQNNGNPKRSSSVIFLQEVQRTGDRMTLNSVSVANPDGSNAMPEQGALSCEKAEGVELGLSNARRSISPGRL